LITIRLSGCLLASPAPASAQHVLDCSKKSLADAVQNVSQKDLVSVSSSMARSGGVLAAG